MNVVKSVIRAVWPIIYKVLSKLAEKTETEWDDRIMDAISYAVLEWLDSDDGEDVRFE